MTMNSFSTIECVWGGGGGGWGGLPTKLGSADISCL